MKILADHTNTDNYLLLFMKILLEVELRQRNKKGKKKKVLELGSMRTGAFVCVFFSARYRIKYSTFVRMDGWMN